ncbi:Mif2/CENP-C like-domain-containing protein [Annulohypoxylon maeteangense]|uniref:Mif2/CENP-C like-domain-containing protein n=1 Tax=Annulohypoxylon maeteangense TaxID=1927788 RepID=UPI002008B1BC|nr:Mif2/CENP-C like-domain-containing protein [Annulohypoxylon maeteangense]KAI0884678.1 Mif2/CENP-C like-domain-containing protein [Annulohypoxylon maeteangense]
MPPKQQSSQRRTTQSQNEAVYDLGKQGRKTGLTLAERERDEHGFENVDALFSSPEKDVNNVTVNGINRRGHDEIDEEQTMEIDDESQMGPATIMRQRHNRPSLPRARSPLKTHLQSPARQNPHLGPTSSPARGSIVTAPEHSASKTVNRRLDFSKGPQSRLNPQVNGASKVNGAKGRPGKLTNGHSRTQDSDEEDDAILRGRRNPPLEEEGDEEQDEGLEEYMQGVDAGGDYMDLEEDQDDAPIEPEPEPEPEEEELEPTPPTKKRRGRKPKSPVVVQEEEGDSSTASARSIEAEVQPAKKQRGRPAKGAQSKKSPEPAEQPTKRRRSERNSGSSNVEEQGEEEQENNVEERETKRQRNDKKEAKAALSKPTATKEKGKPGRKRKSSGIGVDEPVVQRGPPLPKGRGLVTLHREEEDNMRTTRSGRHSYRPIQYWKGERVIYDDAGQDIFEDKKQRFVIPSVAGVIRKTDSYTEPRKRRPGRPSKGGAKKGRPSVIEEEDVERDDWEYDPGRVTGECIFWQPDQEAQPDDGDLVVAEEELAISEAAIQLKDIKDATFRFAKTLTMPFFGSGIVDMPPGAEKRTKNSRKMQMVFFVHSGSVEVTVAQTEFRIGKGGMWFVPRGNHYSILNDSPIPARIFFAQGCEMAAMPEGFEGTQE